MVFTFDFVRVEILDPCRLSMRRHLLYPIWSFPARFELVTVRIVLCQSSQSNEGAFFNVCTTQSSMTVLIMRQFNHFLVKLLWNAKSFFTIVLIRMIDESISHFKSQPHRWRIRNRFLSISWLHCSQDSCPTLVSRVTFRLSQFLLGSKYV